MYFMKQYAKAYVAEIKGEDIIGAVASSGSMDRDGDILVPSGWELDNFRKNPVLLWAHDSYSLPIGKATDISIVGNDLRFNAKFAEAENEFAGKVAKLMRGGFLNSFSVGFIPKERDEAGRMNKMELLEISVVNVPANAEARNNRDFKAFEEAVKKLEKKQDKSPMCRIKDESKEDCIKRKIPEIMEENTDMEQDQAVAMAHTMCDTACEDKEKMQKQGRIFSDKNRKTLSNVMDSMMQAYGSLKTLMEEVDAMEQPESQPVSRSNDEPDKKIKVDGERKADDSLIRALRIADRTIELALKELKK